MGFMMAKKDPPGNGGSVFAEQGNRKVKNYMPIRL